ncbi:hypothetical protein GUJ93_ZPchr0012g20995 [Zizania palustris]|uniref:Uncharacterized protein n=1 Tax=Zizania palustris TaxID=103762 RepID=A0A8J5WK28_ZIZPA|nr:hypothetical protein GUJ93_ZPchr0012g20995 [Zizania palustris]
MLRLQKQLSSLLRGDRESPLPSLHRLLHSTASTSNFSVDDYLVTACGLTRGQTPRASRLLSRLKSPSKPDAVLAFLSGLGLSRSDIAAIVAADPKFLCSKVDRNLAPRVADLRGLGLSDSEIACLVLASPIALRTCDMASRVDFLVPIFGSFDEFIRAIKRSGRVLTSSLDRVVKPNIAYLKQCGLNVSDVAKLHLSGNWVLSCTLEKLKQLMVRVDKLGVPRSSGQFKYALATLACLTQEKIDSKRETLKRTLECTEEQLLIALVKHPCLLKSSEDNLRSTAEFLITQVGLEPEYIVHRPALLSYSLKRRLMPRYLVMKALQEKWIETPEYFSVVSATEKQFWTRYIDRHKESVPGVADVYTAACAKLDLEGSLQLQQ